MTSTNGSLKDQQYAEYLAATEKLGFVKDPYTATDAIIHDKSNTNEQRVLQWIKRRAWGAYSLYAVLDDRSAAIQADCAKDLKLNKGTVSAALKKLVARNYVRMDGKVMYPVIAPSGEISTEVDPASTLEISTEVDPASTAPSTFQNFIKQWKVEHASTFAELEVADATSKRIRLVINVAYKKFRRAQQNGPLPYRDLEIQEDLKIEEDPKEREPLSPVQQQPVANGHSATAVAVYSPPPNEITHHEPPPEPLLGPFAAWWGPWSAKRGSDYRKEAQDAWRDVITPENVMQCFICTAGYLNSLTDPRIGFNPHNFLRRQAQSGFTTVWPLGPERKLSAFERMVEMMRPIVAMNGVMDGGSNGT